MEGNELIAFQIISAVGTARSCYIEAIQAAKQGDYAGAAQLIAEGEKDFVEGHDAHAKGEKDFVEGHDAHAKLLEQEANGTGEPIGLLILHAEDQLMSAEAFKTIAQEFIELYQRLDKQEGRV